MTRAVAEGTATSEAIKSRDPSLTAPPCDVIVPVTFVYSKCKGCGMDSQGGQSRLFCDLSQSSALLWVVQGISLPECSRNGLLSYEYVWYKGATQVWSL